MPGRSTYIANSSDHPYPPVLGDGLLTALTWRPKLMTPHSNLSGPFRYLQSHDPSRVLSPELPTAPKSCPPATQLPSPLPTAASAQKRRMRRKRLWAPALDQSRERDPAPDQGPERAAVSMPDQGPDRAAVSTSSPGRAPVSEF